jgi:hypothetical protein
MQGRVDVPEKYAATQVLLGTALLCSGKESFLGARNAASNQDQETTRMNRAAAKQRDRCPLDHQVTCQDAGSDRLEFQ